MVGFVILNGVFMFMVVAVIMLAIPAGLLLALIEAIVQYVYYPEFDIMHPILSVKRHRLKG